MKRTFTNRLRIFLISAGLIFTGYMIVRACADGGWEIFYDSNFAPETFVSDKAYTPFFFDSYYRYYGGDYDDDYNNRFAVNNVHEWSAFLGTSIDTQALDFLLNKTSYRDALNLEAFYEGKQALNDPLKKYSPYFNKADSRQQAFARYLALAKACESFATNNESNEWDYNTDRRKQPARTGPVTASLLEKNIEQATEPFLKQRYWFQLVRYNFFFDLPMATAAFDKYQNSFDKNTMYYRTMAYAAGAYYKQQHYSKANYYYSLVFAAHDELKRVAHWSFHPQEEADWQQTLALCKNDDERIVLWQMLGLFYKDETRSIDEIIKINSASPAVDILLTRAVNQTETSYNIFVDSSRNVPLTYQWCRKITDHVKTSNPFLWQVATGYLAFLQDDYAASRHYYALAAKQLPNTVLAKKQVRLLQLLTNVASIKTITPKEEQLLLPELKWLYDINTETSPDEHLRYSNAQTVIKKMLSVKYKEQGDPVKSECFSTQPEFYLSDKNVNDLKAFLSKSHPSEYELLCRQFSEKSVQDLWEYQSVQAAFKDDLDKAISDMSHAGENGERVLAGNPFNGNIRDCHDCDHAKKQSVKYNKLSFLRKMKEMKDNVNAGTDVYNNALLLANGYYNATHFGNARYFYEGTVLGEGHGEPEMIDSVFRRMLTDNSLSVKYYTIALQNAGNDEQKAKSLYMLAKCERNDWYRKTFFNFTNKYVYNDEKEIDFITWNSFKTLKRYKHTQYYKDIIAECGYFRTAMQR